MAKHILVATDGSQLADNAVTYALDLAKSTNSKVTAVTVTELWSPLDISSKVQAGHLKAIDDFEKHAAENAEKIFEHVRELAAASGVKINTKHIPDSHPADGILKARESENCDLIVMSSHGRRGLSQLVLGSQAHEVLSRSKVPVLICK